MYYLVLYRFIASLQCGEEPTAYPGVAFQLKPQLDGTHDVGIVSLGGTEWVEMVTFLADFPFKPGMPFIIKVEALEKEYKVTFKNVITLRQNASA